MTYVAFAAGVEVLATAAAKEKALEVRHPGAHEGGKFRVDLRLIAIAIICLINLVVMG